MQILFWLIAIPVLIGVAINMLIRVWLGIACALYVACSAIERLFQFTWRIVRG